MVEELYDDVIIEELYSVLVDEENWLGSASDPLNGAFPVRGDIDVEGV